MTSSTEQTPLTVEQAFKLWTGAGDCPLRALAPLTLAVRVSRPGTAGGTPVSRIVNMQAGFDWDAGVMLLTPEHDLTTLSREAVADIRTSVESGQSWHAHQVNKRYRDQISELEMKVTTLTSERAHLLDAVPYSWVPGAANGSEVLRLGSNIVGGIRCCPDGTFETTCSLPGVTLALSGLATAEAARNSLEQTAGQWLKNLLA